MTSQLKARHSFGRDRAVEVLARVRRTILPTVAASGLLVVAACQDAPRPTDPAVRSDVARQEPRTFEVAQLQEWHERSLGLFEIAGVVFTDVDEENNRLIVAVDDLGLARAVERQLDRLGIPSGAVTIQETAPIVLLATLQEFVRPLEGGLQIEFSKGICSLGFNAVRQVDLERGFEEEVQGFVVPSHCTDEYGGIEGPGTEHHQPTVAQGNLIGQEIADPEFFQCAINVRECRESDSAFDRLDSQLAPEVDAALGHIARPTGVNDGSLAIDGSFRITAELARNAALGQILGKVGRTTGLTEGEVTHSCVHVRLIGQGIGGPKVFLCQDFLAALAEPGDSGSPVFAVTGNLGSEPTDVTLHGILWAATADGTSLVYSPIHNVEEELGELDTCAEEFNC